MAAAADTLKPIKFSHPHHQRQMIVLAVILLVLIGLFISFYFYYPYPDQPISPINREAHPNTQNDLGTTLYEKAQNPIQDQLPQTVAPVTNPLENAYQNPFE